MTKGDYVRFKYPADVKESLLLFEVLEMRETRILVREVIHIGITNPYYIRPTFVYSASELESATEGL